MLWFLTSVIGVTSAAILVMGALALLNNPNKLQNRYFFIFSFILSLWMIANFIDSNPFSQGLVSVALRFDLFLALYLALMFIIFVDSFEVPNMPHSSRLLSSRMPIILIFLLNAIFSVLVFADQVTRVVVGDSGITVEYKNLFFAYVGVIICYFIYGFGILIRKRHFAKGNTRAGLGLIFSGLITATIANVLTNTILPVVISSETIVKGLNVIGYAGLIIMALSFFVSITRQRLFEIRVLVVRSLAYVLSLASIALLFILITTGIGHFVEAYNLSVSIERIVYAVLAVLLAMVFPKVKKLFDKLSDRLFYQDAYDPQLFLDSLNQVLVGTIDLKLLVESCSTLLAEKLKVEHCTFMVQDPTSRRPQLVGTERKKYHIGDLVALQALMAHGDSNIIAADYLPADSHRLKAKLHELDSAVVVHLVSQTDREHERRSDIGYLLLGQKRSGNTFTSQDLRVLGLVANELVIAIQNATHFEEIQRFNVTLQDEVDHATARLRRINKRLEELDNIKDDFISMASHQLRTPLTSVKGYLSMVLEGDAGKLSPMQGQMLKQAFTSSQRMVFLITDLLNVSRLKTGKFVIDRAPVNLDHLIDEELDQLHETAAAKGIELKFVHPKKFPELMLDEVKTRQVIMNFVDNAIYYTPQGGHIRVELVEKPSTIELKVVDDGIGVPKEEQHHLFTKFYRATNARKARPDGTGLGLFMAQKVITAQGGSVLFSSRENHGSTFGFTFSKSRLAVPKKLSPTPAEVPVASAPDTKAAK